MVPPSLRSLFVHSVERITILPRTITPFSYVTSVSWTKENMMRNSPNDRISEKGYVPFLANKSLSYFSDSVMLANEINRYHFLDKRPQYEFYLNSLQRAKRFAKWIKNEDSDKIALICKAYSCSAKEAKLYLPLLSDTQIRQIQEQQQTGGLDNGRKKSGRGKSQTQ